MPRHSLILPIVALLLALVGSFFLAIVVAIDMGAWLPGDKMYYATVPWCHFFGAAGVALRVLLACGAWRIAPTIGGQTSHAWNIHQLQQTGGR